MNMDSTWYQYDFSTDQKVVIILDVPRLNLSSHRGRVFHGLDTFEANDEFGTKNYWTAEGCLQIIMFS